MNARKKKNNSRAILFSSVITTVFFIVVSFGLLHHEMWRDELQAWLVAKDAHSIRQLFVNMRYEGNPALWHLFLFAITCFTHNPIAMQVLHLIIASGFIYVFNRYAEIRWPYKILFTFSYFALYEYSIISRSYGLAVLLIFITCSLYKNRHIHYVLLGIILALLANVTIYGAIFSIGFSAIIILDYFWFQKKDNPTKKNLFKGLVITVIGVMLSIYQILPKEDNTFPIHYPDSFFEMDRWLFTISRVLTSLFYIPKMTGMNFWNSNFIYNNDLNLDGTGIFFHNTENILLYILMPFLMLCLSFVVFIRKPVILLLYSIIICGLLAIYYYTDLFFLRYCGFLLINFITCYWLMAYYPERMYKRKILAYLSTIGYAIRTPLLAGILLISVIGSVVAYSKDFSDKFTPSKDVAGYIHENRLDTLTVAGANCWILSPIAAYLDTDIYYFQINGYGTFCIYNNEINLHMSSDDLTNSILRLVENKKDKFLLVSSYELFPVTHDGGRHYNNSEHGFLTRDYKFDLIKYFESGVVADERYFVYVVQKNNTDNLDFFRKILLHDPENMDVQRAIANTYFERQVYDSAEIHFIKSNALYSDDPTTRMYLGCIYLNTNRYQLALDEFRKIILSNPYYLTAYSYIGKLHYQLAQYKEAAEALSVEYMLEPKKMDDISLIALSYQKIGQVDSAEKYENIAQIYDSTFKLTKIF